MGLKWRLFLWIGILFFIGFVISYFLEIRLTGDHLRKAEKSLRDQIIGQKEESRQQLQQFLHVEIAENQAKIDALLQRVTQIPPSRFDSSVWVNAANFFLINEWVDFLQSSQTEGPAAVIIPNLSAVEPASLFPIEENMVWVNLGKDSFIGIRLLMTLEEEHESLALYLLFPWETVLKYEATWKQVCCSQRMALGFTSFEDYQTAMNAVLAQLERAVAYLKKAGTSEPIAMRAWIQKEIQKAPAKTAPPVLEACQQTDVGQLLKQLILRDEQIAMIWDLLMPFAAGPFGSTPFDPTAPMGVAHFAGGSNKGEGIRAKKLFSAQVFFDDSMYYQQHAPGANCWKMGNSTALIPSPSTHELYLGNTLNLDVNNKKSFLTIGVSADEILQKLSLATHELSFIVNGCKILGAYSDEGKKTTLDLPIQTMLEKTSGLVDLDGKSYFFLHMQPLENEDLHFFVLNLEEKEFALVSQLDEGSKKVIEAISFEMRIVALVCLIIVLILLQRISYKITRPIINLAGATKFVAEGKWEEARAALRNEKPKDEVAELYSSFDQMVTGLQEREKVKGVLNKVVSAEIAAEILKGNVHLGGEEKKVTVLFADIRHFTAMTQHMPPHEVIDLLNQCMTKISRVIDEHGGVIDKYVGDEVMALFGAPLERGDSVLQSIYSAWEMRKVLEQWNKERSSKGLPEVTMGIGIHSGTMIAGNMGAENRLNYTVLGSNVNLAARLCSAAEPMQILISKDTLESPGVKENITVKELPPVKLKGFDEAVPIFEVLGAKKQ